MLFGTNALGCLGFKLYDGPNNEMIEFETSDMSKKDLVTVIYRAILEPKSTRIMEFGVENGLEGEEILISPLNSSDVRVETTVASNSAGKVLAPVTNWSTSSVLVHQGFVVGKVERMQEVAEAENFLYSSLVSNFAVQSPCVLNMKVRALDDKMGRVLVGSLEDADKMRLDGLIKDFEGIFALRDEDLTQTDLVEHEIDTGEAAPIRQRMRPVAYTYREKVAEMIQDYLGRGLVRPSQSPWASPIVIVPKGRDIAILCGFSGREFGDAKG